MDHNDQSVAGMVLLTNLSISDDTGHSLLESPRSPGSFIRNRLTPMTPSTPTSKSRYRKEKVFTFDQVSSWSADSNTRTPSGISTDTKTVGNSTPKNHYIVIGGNGRKPKIRIANPSNANKVEFVESQSTTSSMRWLSLDTACTQPSSGSSKSSAASSKWSDKRSLNESWIPSSRKSEAVEAVKGHQINWKDLQLPSVPPLDPNDPLLRVLGVVNPKVIGTTAVQKKEISNLLKMEEDVFGAFKCIQIDSRRGRLRREQLFHQQQNRMHSLHRVFRERISTLNMLLNHDQKTKNRKIKDIEPISQRIKYSHSVLGRFCRFHSVFIESERGIQDMAGDLVQNAVNEKVLSDTKRFFLHSLTMIFALNVEGEAVSGLPPEPTTDRIIKLMEIIEEIKDRITYEFATIYDQLESSENRVNQNMNRLNVFFKKLDRGPRHCQMVNMESISRKLMVDLKALWTPQVALHRMLMLFVPKLQALTECVVDEMKQFMAEWMRYVMALHGFTKERRDKLQSKYKRKQRESTLSSNGSTRKVLQWIKVNESKKGRMIHFESEAVDRFIDNMVVRECSVDVMESGIKREAQMILTQSSRRGQKHRQIELFLYGMNGQILHKFNPQRLKAIRFRDNDCSLILHWDSGRKPKVEKKRVRWWFNREDDAEDPHSRICIKFMSVQEYELWRGAHSGKPLLREKR